MGGWVARRCIGARAPALRAAGGFTYASYKLRHCNTLYDGFPRVATLNSCMRRPFCAVRDFERGSWGTFLVTGPVPTSVGVAHNGALATARAPLMAALSEESTTSTTGPSVRCACTNTAPHTPHTAAPMSLTGLGSRSLLAGACADHHHGARCHEDLLEHLSGTCASFHWRCARTRARPSAAEPNHT